MCGQLLDIFEKAYFMQVLTFLGKKTDPFLLFLVIFYISRFVYCNILQRIVWKKSNFPEILSPKESAQGTENWVEMAIKVGLISRAAAQGIEKNLAIIRKRQY